MTRPTEKKTDHHEQVRPATTVKQTPAKAGHPGQRRLRRRRPRRPRPADRARRRAARHGRRRRHRGQDAAFVARFCRADVEVVDGSRRRRRPAAEPRRCGPGSSSRRPSAAATSSACSTATPSSTPPAPRRRPACAKAGMPFEVVPGVSAVSAVPGVRRRPADQRQGTARCGSSTSPRAVVDWDAVAAGKATLVLLSATR